MPRNPKPTPAAAAAAHKMSRKPAPATAARSAAPRKKDPIASPASAAPARTAARKAAPIATPAAVAPRRAAPRKAAASAPARTPAPGRTAARKPLDLVLLGATGYTGRQAVRALLRQRPDARWAVAGRDRAKLESLVAEMLPAGARAPEVLVADTRDAASLDALARPAKVLFNLAGPYHATGDAVVAACIARGTHYLDLSAETFWIQRLVREQHRAAEAARLKIIPCAGYEALPFDLATLWAAHQLRAQCGEPCAQVRIAVVITGKTITRPQDVLSGGTAATMRELLRHDRSGCLSDMACLLPPGTPDAQGVARRNALRWVPQVDPDLHTVLAPALPAPFINPPVVLRGIALMDDPGLFDAAFEYREGTHMGRVLPGAGLLPQRASLALQWAAAAAMAAPLVNLGASIGGPLQFQRGLLARLLEQVSPKQGSGPSETALDAVGYELHVVARGASGARFRGRVVAAGHPGYRSTPEMTVCAALGLADGSLGRTKHYGIVSPAAGLGIEAVAALKAAGVDFIAGG